MLGFPQGRFLEWKKTSILLTNQPSLVDLHWQQMIICTTSPKVPATKNGDNVPYKLFWGWGFPYISLA